MKEWNRKFKEKHGIAPVTKWRRENIDATEIHRDTERQRYYSDPTHKEKAAKRSKAFRGRTKAETFIMYGGHFCQCCGEQEFNFLSLDHIANNGAAERKELGYSGTGHAFYRRLKKLGFPSGYQVLCMNCNFGKRMNGGVCPHKK